MYTPSLITVHGYCLSHERFITTTGRVLNINNNFPISKLMYIQFLAGNPNKALRCMISDNLMNLRLLRHK